MLCCIVHTISFVVMGNVEVCYLISKIPNLWVIFCALSVIDFYLNYILVTEPCLNNFSTLKFVVSCSRTWNMANIGKDSVSLLNMFQSFLGVMIINLSLCGFVYFPFQFSF